MSTNTVASRFFIWMAGNNVSKEFLRILLLELPGFGDLNRRQPAGGFPELGGRKEVIVSSAFTQPLPGPIDNLGSSGIQIGCETETGVEDVVALVHELGNGIGVHCGSIR